ncbi:hypothetical protein [Comamonas sp.]|uniref:hypothetical protein n=1 Tax=Comamonas sp. TaxID=34028 RepID=UPI002899D16A|nr:hypothetical protein [Comamonas sp.]
MPSSGTDAAGRLAPPVSGIRVEFIWMRKNAHVERVAFMTFLDGIDAKAGETKYDYSLRFSALEDNLSMAKRRQDLELE